ncbi:hypothetical protein [Parendozoicomonas sp. Alg238-R29]|uniref:hypothetical protein n=1 Tax=Parendozoicomonas sp. Alg238-R29 TaxID=2993446 RepID=UPI00248EF74A|nr:hypothetical protein [Parendozoicomonas sp. Alg238-R29]
MGLVVITFMATLDIGTGKSSFIPAMVGFAGAVVGSIISTRLMQRMVRPFFAETGEEIEAGSSEEQTESVVQVNDEPQQTGWLRVLNSLLDGGKSGVELGLAIIPGVLIISSIVMIMTFGAPEGGYTGAAYEGVALLPWLAGHVSWLFFSLFGFQAPELVAFPMTSLGAVGAAMLDTLGYRSLTSKALLAHTVGGIAAGVVARYLFLLALLSG